MGRSTGPASGPDDTRSPAQAAPDAEEATIVNPPVPTLVTARAGRLRMPRWVTDRDRLIDAGARWAFAGTDRSTGEPSPRSGGESTAPERHAILPVDVLPRAVQIVVAWALAALVVAWAVRSLMDVVGALAAVLIPLAVAVLLAAFLNPLCRWLTRGLHLHRGVAAAVSVLGLATVLIAGSAFAAAQLASGLTDLTASVTAGVDAVVAWLHEGPLHLSNAQLEQYVARAEQSLQANGSMISDGALAAGTSTIDFIAGTVVCLISTFFFLYDGHRIWSFLTGLLPRGARGPVFEAGRRGWVSLSAYSRTQMIVATADAVGIAGGALLLGLPLVAPLFFIVLVASVVPIVGAIVAGAVSVLMALVVEGPGTALMMLVIVLVVQQIEAHVLQPFLMGRAVDLHPLAVIVAVTAAAYLFGVPGALFAVPLLAFVNMAVRYLLGNDPFPEIGTFARDEAAGATSSTTAD